MATLLRVLHLEDNPDDSELVQHQLRRDGFVCDLRRAETKEDYLAALDAPIDIILADYSLPNFDAPGALALLQERGLNIPFIVVSGAVGDEQAVECLKQGAADYILKDRLGRLGQAMERALEQQRLRAEIFQAEEQLRLLSHAVEQSPVSIIVTDTTGKILYVNPKFTQVSGYSAEEVLGQNPRILKSGETPPEVYKSLWETITAGREWRGEFHDRKKNGELYWENASISPIINEAGQITHYVAVKEDITETKRAETELKESKRFLQSTLDSLSSHIAVLDKTGTIIAVNEAWCQFAEANGAVLSRTGLGTNYLKVCESAYGSNGEEAPRAAEGIRKVLAGTSDQFTLEYPCHSATEQRWFLLQVTKFSGMGPHMVVVDHEDITSRKRNEEAIRASEVRYRRLFEAAKDGVLILNAETGQIEDINPFLVALLGLSREELVGKAVWELGAFSDILASRKHFQELQQEEFIRYDDLPLITADGRHIAVEFVSNVYLVNAHKVVQCSIRDITEHKRSEALLMEQARMAALGSDIGSALTRRAELKQTLQMCTEAIVHHLDAGFAHIWLLDEAENTLNLVSSAGMNASHDAPNNPGDIQVPVGKHRVGLIALNQQPIFSNDLNTDKRSDDKQWATNEGMVSFAGYPLRVDDRLVGVLSLFANQPLSELICQSLGTVADEIALGIERKYAEEALRQSRDELEDRVEERTTELEQAREVADSANRAKSEFLSRMSHELRTPLNAILGFGQILEMREQSDLDRESVGHILKGGRHLLELINEILDIARIEAGRIKLSIEPVDVAEVVAESLDMVRPIAPQYQVNILSDASKIGHATILADRQRIKQVLINLLANAVKYNRPGGTVSVSSHEVAGERLRINVTDTGLGLSPAEIKLLFIPFERINADKTGVEGTGLGLTLSHRLVEAMNGTIGVESVKGQGCTFFIELPLVETLLKTNGFHESDAKPQTPEKMIGSYTILSIEDNLSNHRLIEAILSERPSVRLLYAMQGSVGLDLAREHLPDLILLDIHLPDIQGDEVLRRLQAEPKTADIPVIIISADATPAQTERLLAAGAAAYLTKPLDVKEFLTVLDTTLHTTLQKGN